MSQNNNIPQIRFKGFNDVWEQCKLNDLGVSTSGTSIESEFSDEGVYNVISIGSYSEDSIYNDQGIKAIHSSKTENRVLDEGDLTMILNDKTQAGRIIGRVLLIEKSSKYIYNQRTQRIQPYKNKFSSEFLYHLLNAPLVRNRIIKQSQGNTQIYVNWSAIKETEYFVPNLVEQEKLGQMFSKINDLITLHQRKHEKYTNLKKALLEKMFPQNGEKIPQIRFKGFTEAWEQCKLGEVFNFERPDLYMVSNDNYDEVGIPVLTANKAFILGYKNESGEYKKGDCIIFDDFTLDCKYVNFPFKVNSSAIKILKSNEKYDLKFSYYLLVHADILMQGHARHYISVVQPTEVFVPKKLEQLKISQILGKVDALITLHQREYEKLKNIKKSLLEKMFV